MKRIFALLLAAVMLLSLAACGGEETPAGTGDPGTPATTEAAKPAAPILGVTDGNTYTNAYFGMGCTLDESWSVANETQLAEIFGATEETLSDLALDTKGLGYAFYASKDEGLTSMNIVMENLGLIYGSVLSEQAYVEQSAAGLPAAMENLGMTNVKAEAITVTFAGSEHAAIKLTAEMSGIAFYETLVCVKQDRYIAVITAASYVEDSTADILAQFHAA